MVTLVTMSPQGFDGKWGIKPRSHYDLLSLNFYKSAKNPYLPMNIYSPQVCYCVFYDYEEVSFTNVSINHGVNKTHFPSPDHCSVGKLRYSYVLDNARPCRCENDDGLYPLRIAAKQ